MCYSAPISLATFALGFGFSVLLTQSTDRFQMLMGYFLGFVSLMQFIEYLLWKHPICDDYNKTVSVFGMILNHLQPVMLALLTGALYGKNLGILALLTIGYLAVIIPYSLQFTSDLQCSTTQCEGNPHLVWQWNTLKFSDAVYAVFLATFAGVGLYGMPSGTGLVFSTVAVASYVLSGLVYDRKVMGSLWCFWTAFIPAVLYGKSRLFA
jgi:hypothetical protein